MVGAQEGGQESWWGRGAWPRRGYLLLLARHKNLVARGRPKAQLVDAGWLLLGMDLHSDPHLKRGLLCEGGGDLRPGFPEALAAAPLPRPVMGQPCPLPTHKGQTCFRSLLSTSSPSQSLLNPTRGHPLASHTGSPTHVLPHGQVLVLLHIQHDLQPVARSAPGGGEKLCPIRTGVEGVALTHPGKDLGVGRRCRPHRGARGSQANPGPWGRSLPHPPFGFLI